MGWFQNVPSEEPRKMFCSNNSHELTHEAQGEEPKILFEEHLEPNQQHRHFAHSVFNPLAQPVGGKIPQFTTSWFSLHSYFTVHRRRRHRRKSCHLVLAATLLKADRCYKSSRMKIFVCLIALIAAIQVGAQREPVKLNPSKLALLPKECGVAKYPPYPTGILSKVFEFPWIALVKFNKTRRPATCFGTLINQRYVLSVIGCVRKTKKDP